MRTKVFIPDATFIWLMAEVSTACSGSENCVEVEITDPIFYNGEDSSLVDGQTTLRRRLVDLGHPALFNKRLPLQVCC